MISSSRISSFQVCVAFFCTPRFCDIIKVFSIYDIIFSILCWHFIFFIPPILTLSGYDMCVFLFSLSAPACLLTREEKKKKSKIIE